MTEASVHHTLLTAIIDLEFLKLATMSGLFPAAGGRCELHSETGSQGHPLSCRRPWLQPQNEWYQVPKVNAPQKNTGSQIISVLLARKGVTHPRHLTLQFQSEFSGIPTDGVLVSPKRLTTVMISVRNL